MHISDLDRSSSLEIVNLVLQRQAKGEKIISLAVGEPAYDTPKDVMDVAVSSMYDGDTHYTSSYGIQEVREAIVDKVTRKNRINAAINNTIFIAAKQAIYAAMIAIAGRRTRILVPNPGYFYTEPALIAGLEPVRYRLNRDLSFDVADVISKMDQRTAAIVLNSPGNPTGRMIEKDDLRILYEKCKLLGIKIISDEAYEDIVYDKRHFSVGSLEEFPDNVISVFSLSKSYSMTGWRAGYTIASDIIVEKMARLIEHTYTCSPPFIQKASAFALKHGDRYIEEFREDFRKKRAFVMKRLSEISGIVTSPIDGAFYAFPSYSIRMSASVLAKEFLEHHNVALLPGSAFGEAGEGHLRISFSGSLESLELGLNELDRYITSKS